MTKAYDEMTFEEQLDERARRLEAREAKLEAEAAFAALKDSEIFDEPQTATIVDPVPSEVVEAAPKWPHDHLTYGGLDLEVRRPNESALIAVSMAGALGTDTAMQMAVFTRFLNKHLSPKSFAELLNTMADPDSDLDIQGIIQALADFRKP